MRAVRIGLVLAGVAAITWGGWLLTPQLTANLPNAVSVASWFVGGPVLHDALLAPVVALAGLAVAVVAPARWRPFIATGLVVSGALVAVALPVLLRPSAGPPNPGLADRDYPLGLAVALAVVWLVVGVAGALRHLVGRRREVAR